MADMPNALFLWSVVWYQPLTHSQVPYSSTAVGDNTIYSIAMSATQRGLPTVEHFASDDAAVETYTKTPFLGNIPDGTVRFHFLLSQLFSGAIL